MGFGPSTPDLYNKKGTEMSQEIFNLLKELSTDIKEIRKENRKFEVSIEKLSKTMEYEIENRSKNEIELNNIKTQLILIQQEKTTLTIKTQELDQRQKSLEEKIEETEEFNKNLTKNTIKIVLGICGFIGGVATWALTYFFK